MPVRWHVEDPELLAEAFRFTAADTGFSPRLVEKDYFCTVLLEDIGSMEDPPVFKGGTCLAKVHSRFHRLSEDLDFSIGISAEAPRPDRRQAMAPAREHLADVVGRLPGFRILRPLTGFNGSRQYNSTLGYSSLLADTTDTIKLEIGVREPIREMTMWKPARTLVLDPGRGTELVPAIRSKCISHREAMAEKVRAALTRREPAIRDLFDLDHAAQKTGFDFLDDEFKDLLRLKLEVQGTDEVDISERRFESLRRQVDAELLPVLRRDDFEFFDVDRALETVTRLAALIGA